MNKPTFHYFGNKAGVEGASQVKKTIDDITKGSEYYKRQEEKQGLYNQKIEQMLQEIERYKKDSNKMIEASESIKQKIKSFKIKTDRVWAHFDMDMFYVACELLDKPELADKPVAVGGSQIISTSNYIARKFGVRSAMPTFVAKQLCPDLIVLGLNFDKYKTCSNIFIGILKQYDEQLESMGMDEANLDLTQYLKDNDISYDQIEQLAQRIRQQVFQSTKLTCSCGIGPNKMLAKLASERNKPDGLYIIQQDMEAIEQFMEDLPLRKIPGIGMVTEQILQGLGYNFCKDVKTKPEYLYFVLTSKTFEFILQSCYGYSRNEHSEDEDQQSISVSRTFQAIATQDDMEKKIEEIAELLSEDLQSADRIGNHLTLTIKTAKFEVRNKSIQLPQYTNSQLMISQFGKQILKLMWPIEPIRLLGLKMQQLKQPQMLQKQSIQQFCQKKDQKQEQILSNDECSNISNQLIGQKLKTPNPKVFQCPICCKEIDCKGNNQMMNKHIDRCLGGDQQSNHKSNTTPTQFFKKK
ncbi:hypothetical protein pb186bvf_020874 [Paramecium bursaria]